MENDCRLSQAPLSDDVLIGQRPLVAVGIQFGDPEKLAIQAAVVCVSPEGVGKKQAVWRLFARLASPTATPKRVMAARCDGGLGRVELSETWNFLSESKGSTLYILDIQLIEERRFLSRAVVDLMALWLELLEKRVPFVKTVQLPP